MSGSPVIEATDLELSYGAQLALAASSFRVLAGSLVTAIGPNGSGKSTLLAAITGLHADLRGQLTVLGLSPTQARRRVALVLQSTKVNETLPVTVREVIGMGRYASLGLTGRFRAPDRRAVDLAMEQLDLHPLSSHHLAELSGGQRQRVFVAQGLVQEHDLLLMDEPLTGLDLVSAGVIERVIEEERDAGKTVLITTHDLADAARADQVLLLSGRVVASGPPHEVLVEEHLTAAYRSHVLDAAGHVLLDDAAHRPADPRHVHIDLGASTHHHD